MANRTRASGKSAASARSKRVDADRAEPKPNKAAELDRLSAIEIATWINREDAKVSRAVRQELPDIAEAIDLIAERLRRGGRLIYVGSGTSGRIGALDAAECPPTFGADAKMVQAMIAGGQSALARASEGTEDSAALGERDMAQRRPGKKDVVVGISASGGTPYTIAALQHARKKGAATIAIVCRKHSELARVCQLSIEADTGAEVLSGSTRLKAGTAQKMICNMLTTGAMARLGYVYGNEMVRLQTNNAKLVERGVRIIERLTGVDGNEAERALEAAGRNVPLALLMLRGKLNRSAAERMLMRAHGNVREALHAAGSASRTKTQHDSSKR